MRLTGWDVTTGGLAPTTVSATLRSDQLPPKLVVCQPRILKVNGPLAVGVPVSVPRVESVVPGGNPERAE